PTVVLLFRKHTAPPSHSPLSLHDALPISPLRWAAYPGGAAVGRGADPPAVHRILSSCLDEGIKVHGSKPNELADLEVADASFKQDRKSTRLNSSHVAISYAVFCLKKKKMH